MHDLFVIRFVLYVIYGRILILIFSVSLKLGLRVMSISFCMIFLLGVMTLLFILCVGIIHYVVVVLLTLFRLF